MIRRRSNFALRVAALLPEHLLSADCWAKQRVSGTTGEAGPQRSRPAAIELKGTDAHPGRPRSGPATI